MRQNKYYELQRDFINNMTHEFKTPLSSIIIASEYFNNNPEIKNDERLTKYADAIINQSRRLNSHIERILNLAKSEKKSFPLHVRDFNIVPVLQNAVGNFKLQYDKQIDIQLRFHPDEIFISADKGHFINVITNLLDNSCKYSKLPAHIEMTADQLENKVIIKITDKGRGISRKHMKRLFDKFYRVPRENTEQTEGFGLGLYYVKKICDQHKWTVKIKSEPSVGTEVQITITLK